MYHAAPRGTMRRDGRETRDRRRRTQRPEVLPRRSARALGRGRSARRATGGARRYTHDGTSHRRRARRWSFHDARSWVMVTQPALMLFVCTGCNENKPLEAFSTRGPKSGHRRTSMCKSCLAAGQRSRHRRVRQEALNHYGAMCACPGCNERHYEFLTFDHIGGDGAAHRRMSTIARSAIADWLKKNGYPAGFRVLCFNCNTSIEYHGYCPHNKDVSQ